MPLVSVKFDGQRESLATPGQTRTRAEIGDKRRRPTGNAVVHVQVIRTLDRRGAFHVRPAQHTPSDEIHARPIRRDTHRALHFRGFTGIRVARHEHERADFTLRRRAPLATAGTFELCHIQIVRRVRVFADERLRGREEHARPLFVGTDEFRPRRRRGMTRRRFHALARQRRRDQEGTLPAQAHEQTSGITRRYIPGVVASQFSLSARSMFVVKKIALPSAEIAFASLDSPDAAPNTG